MNIIALSIIEQSAVFVFALLILIFFAIISWGKKYNKEHTEFLQEVAEKFPGCTITSEDDCCSVRIIYKNQPLLVTKGFDGSIKEGPYEPDVTEAIS